MDPYIHLLNHKMLGIHWTLGYKETESKSPVFTMLAL